MLHRLLLITPLVASLGAAASLDAGLASGGGGGAVARSHAARMQARAGKCALKPEQPRPAVAGFRLGMTFGEAAARLDKFPQLARFTSGDKELDLREASGEQAVSARGDDPGVVSLLVHGRHAPADATPGEFTTLGMVFVDGRLGLIAVNGWRSPRWKEIYEFRERAEDRIGLTDAQWRVSRPPVRLPPGSYPDFLSDTHELDCDGLTVTASCVGPPGPPDLCDLSVWDAEAAKTIVARGREAGGKEGRRP